MQTAPKHIEREPLRLFQKNSERKNKAPVFKVTKNTKPQPSLAQRHIPARAGFGKLLQRIMHFIKLFNILPGLI